MVIGGGKTFSVYFITITKHNKSSPFSLFYISCGFRYTNNCVHVTETPSTLYINPDISYKHLIRQWFEQFYFRETLNVKYNCMP